MDSGLARCLSSGRALRGPVDAPRNDEREERYRLHDLAFKPIISEAGRMTSDLRELPVFIASPRLRGEDVRWGKL
jgi:hypothetical protein